MVLARVPKVLFLVAAIVAVYMLMTILHMAGMAHAQGLPTTPAPTPGSGIPWEVILLGIIAFMSSIRTVLQFIAPRTKTTVDDKILAGVNEVIGIVGGQPRGFARASLMTGLGVVGLVAALAIGGCAGSGSAVRGKVTVGANAFLDCEAPNVAALVQDLTPFVVGTLRAWISGDGHPDRAGIRADAAKISTMAGQCAWDAAIAILTTPAAPSLGAPQSSPQAVNVGELAAVARSVRGELGWASAGR